MLQTPTRLLFQIPKLFVRAILFQWEFEYFILVFSFRLVNYGLSTEIMCSEGNASHKSLLVSQLSILTAIKLFKHRSCRWISTPYSFWIVFLTIIPCDYIIFCDCLSIAICYRLSNIFTKSFWTSLIQNFKSTTSSFFIF